jgi:hypothetical protein
MAQAQDMAFLHRTLPRGALAATKRATKRAAKWERAIASRRFWRSDIFLRAHTGCHRGMFYSLLIHFAFLSALIASPISIPRSEASVKAYLMPMDSRLSAAVATATGISRQVETPPICCAPQTILSNPPHATNHMQTILQPDLPNPPSLENFIPLPNILTLQRLSWRPGLLPGANIALELPPMPAPDASSPGGEQDVERAVQDGRDPADDADGTRDTLAVSVFPAPPSEAVSLPAAESGGRFAENAFSGVPGDSPASAPASSTSAASRAEILFPGLTIQGGEWKADSHPAEPTVAAPPREESQRSSYALTIASSGNSGGGLRDFGVFRSESVFTDYFDVSTPGAPGAQPAPPWVLQYALVTPCCGPQDSIVPPRPMNEVLPAWPQDLVASHSGETIVVSAMIDTDGKLRDTRLVESPSPGLSGGLVEALAAWTFQPAEKNGQPCAVQALLGIPVANSR